MNWCVLAQTILIRVRPNITQGWIISHLHVTYASFICYVMGQHDHSLEPFSNALLEDVDSMIRLHICRKNGPALSAFFTLYKLWALLHCFFLLEASSCSVNPVWSSTWTKIIALCSYVLLASSFKNSFTCLKVACDTGRATYLVLNCKEKQMILDSNQFTFHVHVEILTFSTSKDCRGWWIQRTENQNFV